MRKPKQEPLKPKRSAAQIRADKAYQKRTRETKNATQRENFKNIAATFRKDEAERIAEIFKVHGVKPSEVLRGAAAALLDGESIRTESAPLAIPAESEPVEVAEDNRENGGEE